MAYERTAVKRLFYSGIALAVLPIFTYAVLSLMMNFGWITTDFPAIGMMWCGIGLVVSLFGMGLFVVGCYMANKNIKEMD